TYNASSPPELAHKFFWWVRVLPFEYGEFLQFTNGGEGLLVRIRMECFGRSMRYVGSIENVRWVCTRLDYCSVDRTAVGRRMHSIFVSRERTWLFRYLSLASK